MKALALFIAFLVVVLALVLADRMNDTQPDEVHVVASRSTTEITAWPVDTQPSLPENFDQLVHLQVRARTAPKHVGSSIWDAIARCESGGNWADTRGGYEGGVHFLHSTWVAAGGRRYAEHAYQATREQQIEIAQSWLERTSWAQWPVCSRKVGAR